MKINLLALTLLVVLSACTPNNKTLYNGSPVINATSDYTEYKVGNDWYKGQWSIAPQVEHDTLEIICYGSKQAFKFKTDSDSIAFDIPVNATKDFYVKMNDSIYAHTVIKSVPFKTNPITFNTEPNSEISIKYQTEPNTYLNELKQTFTLDFINDTMTDTEVALAVLNWTNSRWEHNGNNSPSKNDAITILNEASTGNQFPCFAYAIVLRDQLNALGYKARTIYLKTEDAENRKRPPGHVATEVFLNDIQQWVFLDGQFNIMPTLNGKPLNAVEFQNAITNHFDAFELQSLPKNKTSKESYVDFVYDYLFYFDVALDSSYGDTKKHTINDKRSIMLVPLDAKNLIHVGFWNLDVNYCIYTNSKDVFYAKP